MTWEFFSKEGVQAFFAIVIAVLTYVLKDLWDKKKWDTIKTSRRAALTGTWMGQIDQPPLFGEITSRFTATRKELFGDADLRLRKRPEDAPFVTIPLSLRGGFLYERFLRIEYATKGNDAVGFGSIVLELDAAGRTLKGRYVGFGQMNEQIVSGSIALRKVI